MIVQPYAFKGDDFDKVYAQAREFISRLRVDAGVSVTLPDGFRSNTKYYPDWDRTMTVIEVFPDIAVDEQIEGIERIHAGVVASPEPEKEYGGPYPEGSEEAKREQAQGDDFDPFLPDVPLP